VREKSSKEKKGADSATKEEMERKKCDAEEDIIFPERLNLLTV
jgi:hypothetical protein